MFDLNREWVAEKKANEENLRVIREMNKAHEFKMVKCCFIWFDLIWFDLIWFDLIWFDLFWCFGCFVQDELQQKLQTTDKQYHDTREELIRSQSELKNQTERVQQLTTQSNKLQDQVNEMTLEKIDYDHIIIEECY